MSNNTPIDVENKINQLKAEAKACIACDLFSTRKHVVFGSGDPHTKLMIIAEGPSATDDNTQLPFTGPAGNLLNDVLAENGLHREEIWLTNTIKCRAATWNGSQFKNRPRLELVPNGCQVRFQSSCPMLSFVWDLLLLK